MEEHTQNIQSESVETVSSSISTEEKKGWWERKTGEKLKRSEKILGGIFLLIFLFVFYVTLDANKYAALVHVIEGEGQVGVNPTSERLDFGDLSRGTSAVRTVTVVNNTPVPMFVAAVRIGNIRSLISDVEPNFFIARRGVEHKIEFTLYVPASAEIDSNYQGRVFIFKVPAPFI